LVELLVVIAIIGILAAVGITAYSGYTQNAKEKASGAQHAQVVAVINAEYAKCAGGDGNFEIAGIACTTRLTDTDLVTHFAISTGDMPLANPYKTDESSVSTHYAAPESPLTSGFAAEDVIIDGRIAVFCDDDGLTGGCTFKTATGAAADTTTTVSRY